MDFYSHQDKATSHTRKLIFLFALAWLCITSVVSAAALGIYYFLEPKASIGADYLRDGLICFCFVTAIILMASFIRLYELSTQGGRSVAEKLGGQLIAPNSVDAEHRQLLNVVEEMAIASGVPVPPVYVLKGEFGINAFAAGLTIDDAVIGITEGAINAFSRDELQGVIAHEFSHILNGDMRLNTRLLGGLFGINFIAQSGHALLEGGSHTSSVRIGYSSSEANKGRIALFIIGLVLVVLGSIGTFFVSLIKASISRQREFLADASAVQFTRNDQGIANALIKIGEQSLGSNISRSAANEVSHMMFGQVKLFNANSWFATHPPLEERIKRISPQWNGEFEVATASRQQQTESDMKNEPVTGFTNLGSGHFSQSHSEALSQAGQSVISTIPEQLATFARDPFTARVIPLLLIFDGSDEHRNMVKSHIPMHFTHQLEPFLEKPIDESIRMPLLELSIPALKTMSTSQAIHLVDSLEHLAETDFHLSLSEWCVINLVEKLVLPPSGNISRRKNLAQLEEPCQIVLSALATACHEYRQDATKAYSDATQHLMSLGHAELSSLTSTQEHTTAIAWPLVKTALSLLVQLKDEHKHHFLEACELSIQSDGEITLEERELFKVIAAHLEVPVPPLNSPS